jgi:hypothetical protein
LDDVVSVYDKTKTYIAGHVSQKTIDGVACLGAGQTQIVDPFTDTGGAFTGGSIYISPNNRLFELSTNALGVLTVALYPFDLDTGVRGSLVGRIQLNMPNNAATTHTVRAFAVRDSGTTGWTIGLGTVGSVLVNGGVFMVNNVDLADFTMSPTVFGMGIANNTKSVYFQQDSGFVGAANNITAISGGDFDRDTGIFYVTSGLVSALVFYGFDMTISPTVNIQTTTGATVPASPTFQLTGHGYVANDQVVLLTNIPTGFIASTATTQAVYYVRATNLTANTFELSATAGGVAVNATSATSNTTITRAHGQTTSGFSSSRKTGIVTGFTGTILLTNSHNICTPVAGHPNAGVKSMFISSSSHFHTFALSNISAGVTSFPSLATVNCLGGAIDITAPTPLQAKYLESIGKIIYTTNTSSFVMKDWVNNAIIKHWGGQQNEWYENNPNVTTPYGFVTIIAMDSSNGWLCTMGSTVGQRVTIIQDVYSSSTLALSYITTPVISTEGYIFKALNTYRQRANDTIPSIRQYKTAATSSDAIFNNPDTGWTTLPSEEDCTLFALNNFTQFRLLTRVIEKAPFSPSQISEVLFTYLPSLDNSENLSLDAELSTQSDVSPAQTVAYLDVAYASVVPKITMTAISKATGLVVRSRNTTDHAAEFEYSTNNGGTWNALGTIPNTVGTRIRYSWAIALPEDVQIVWSEN